MCKIKDIYQAARFRRRNVAFIPGIRPWKASLTRLWLRARVHCRPTRRCLLYRELCELTGASRITARRAISELCDEGVLYTLPGKGIFVAGVEREFEMARFVGMTDEFAQRSQFVTSTWLERTMIGAAPTWSDITKLSPRESLMAGKKSIMLQLQGNINRLLVEAYAERSRRKLLQALLIDPTVSTYANAVALIDEMFARQQPLLPEMDW